MSADECYRKVVDSVISKLKDRGTTPSISAETVENIRSVKTQL